MRRRQARFVAVVSGIGLLGLALSVWATTADAACPAGKFPATGQTTSYAAGDDGDIQAGADLRYKDKGNGTIEDKNTKLVWEKKSADGSIHDQDTFYSWADALGSFIPVLNKRCENDESVDCTANGNGDCAAAGVGGKCGFAGHRDWRLANVKELQSIIDYETFDPAVASPGPFNNNCAANCTVLTCSCTRAGGYWSSTTNALGPAFAWFVDFFNGFVSPNDKIFGSVVRAVRGGCVH